MMNHGVDLEVEAMRYTSDMRLMQKCCNPQNSSAVIPNRVYHPLVNVQLVKLKCIAKITDIRLGIE